MGQYLVSLEVAKDGEKNPDRGSVEFSRAEWVAFCQFMKRVGWSEFRACARDDDEAHEIRDGADKFFRILEQAGWRFR